MGLLLFVGDWGKLFVERIHVYEASETGATSVVRKAGLGSLTLGDEC